MDRENNSTDAVAVVNTDEAEKLTADQIGGPDDFEKLDLRESTSIRKVNLMHSGFHAGVAAAANDYVNDKVNLAVFETLRTERDVTDFYAIGFELGYFRKLAEVLVF
jgi:hypothetical protein